MGMARVILRPGREDSVLRRHPWIFSGAVQEVRGRPSPGETVEVLSSSGAWLAFGAWSPHSQIRVRVWSFDRGAPVEGALFEERIQRCMLLRRDILGARETNAFRLVHAESDGMPGLVVDSYAGFLVCQFSSAGVERHRDAIVDALEAAFSPRGVYERSDTDARTKEGLPKRTGLISGEEPPERVEIVEHGARFLVDIKRGHKTGFYLDQRENRLCARALSSGREVLNCFSYTGAFGVAAMLGGANSVLNVDTSAASLESALDNARLNGIDLSRFGVKEADVFSCLRELRDDGRSFDLVVLDPPKFASTAGQVARAARGYKDINMLAFEVLKPGGLLITFSCSAHIGPALFQKIVADAALDAGREASIVRYLWQASDHPVGLAFPEGLYLKGLVCAA